MDTVRNLGPAPQSLDLPSCLSQGVGADLAFYQQHNAGVAGAEPRIALGRSGTLATQGAQRG